MVGHPLNPYARRENVRALAHAAGLSEDEATVRLDASILVTHDPVEQAAAALVAELTPILNRTMPVVAEIGASPPVTAELVIGRAVARFQGRKVYAVLNSDGIAIDHKPIKIYRNGIPHPLMTLVAACYVAGAAIHRAVGDGLANPPSSHLDIPFSAFLRDQNFLVHAVELREAYLAGAGAIGNGFLWAARHVRLVGKLHVADDDFVSLGNLQRQIWFSDDDVDKPKADRLSIRAEPFLPNCELIPAICRLQEHAARTDGAWLRRLIVAVDSRMARRHLQNELPGEVFDASTTGGQEIVIHHNRQPTDLACLGCVYPHDEAEISHARAVAEHLGIDVEAVRSERITPEIAILICRTHPQLRPRAIEGLAFDTLYKQLCSTGQLRALAGRQVIAPFAFVSVLAGSLLLLELVRQQHDPGSSNEWRINPWWPPVPELRYRRSRRPDCECCERPEVQRINALLWGSAP